jgi:hypothetical protein
MTLPDLGSCCVRRPNVSTLRSRRLVNLVDREKSRSPQIRSLDFIDEFVSRGAKRVAALGDFDKMDPGIEIVEGRQIRLAGILRRINAE